METKVPYITARPNTPSPIRITRSVAQIWAALTPTQRAEVDAIEQCVADTLAHDPLACVPNVGAVTIWLREQLGMIWNFTSGKWEADNA